MKYPLWAIALLLLLPAKAFLQTDDTLSLAQSKAYGLELEAADQLLIRYTTWHQDLDAFILHAWVLYWKKEFPAMEAVFEKAFQSFPGAWSLHLEYGRILWEMGKLHPAEIHLRAYLERDPGHLEANTLLAYLYLWNGHTKKAQNLAYWLLEQDPQNGRAGSVLSEVQAQTIPHLNLTPSWFTDDQPLNNYQAELETGWYQSWLLAPSLQVRFRQSATDSLGYPFFQSTLANRVYLSKTQTRIGLSAGLFSPFSAENTTSFTWGAGLYQTLPAHFALEAGLEKRPYLYTLQSIREPFLERFFQVALHYNLSDKWVGKAAFEKQLFPDDNEVQTAYAWFLAPLLDRWGLRIQAGYGFAYSDAGENRFQPEGIYDPYFTPRDQAIHSLLASIQFSRIKNIHLALRGSAGVYATAGIPYFYLDMDQEGQVYQHRGFQSDRYFPLEIHAEASWKIAASSSLGLAYSYSQLLFYTAHSVGLQFQYLFTRD